MYLTYWNLKEYPFKNDPSPRFFYGSPQHEEALRRFMYATEHQKGVALLTGEVGSGKTTVGRAFMSRLPQHEYEILSIIHPALNPTEFIKAILVTMGLNAKSSSRGVLLERIHQRLLQNADRRVRTMLILDEAHVMEHRITFEQLRMLLNMQSEDCFLITIILMGQPSLQRKLTGFKPLEERIAVKYHMNPLSFEDTGQYVSFRLKKAGAKRGIFEDESFHPIYDYSRGIPLKINNLCDRCLMIGMMGKARGIDPQIVTDALGDLQS